LKKPVALWKQAAAPYSPKWNALMDSLLKFNFTLDPTFNIYEAARDLHKARRQEWHEDYTLTKTLGLLSTEQTSAWLVLV
jgi:hypothetical protein